MSLKHTKKFCGQFMFMQWLRNALPAFMVKSWCLLDLMSFCYPKTKHLSRGNLLCWSLFGSSESLGKPRHIALPCMGATACSHSSTIPFPQGFLRLGTCRCSRDRTLPFLMVAKTRSQMSQQGSWSASAVHSEFLQYYSRQAGTSPAQPSLSKTPV